MNHEQRQTPSRYVSLPTAYLHHGWTVARVALPLMATISLFAGLLTLVVLGVVYAAVSASSLVLTLALWVTGVAVIAGLPSAAEALLTRLHSLDG